MFVFLNLYKVISWCFCFTHYPFQLKIAPKESFFETFFLYDTYISIRAWRGEGRLNDERRLIKKIQKSGDRKAADQLIRTYYDEIYAYVYKQVYDKHRAMDITQDIFIAMLRSISTYDAKKAGFRTWLYRIGTNKLIDYYRQITRMRWEVDITEQIIPDDSHLSFDFENKELLQKITAYLSTFEGTSQQIFRLKVFGDYPFWEIAMALSMPESTVKSKYYRLLKIIRKEYGDEYQ